MWKCIDNDLFRELLQMDKVSMEWTADTIERFNVHFMNMLILMTMTFMCLLYINLINYVNALFLPSRMQKVFDEIHISWITLFACINWLIGLKWDSYGHLFPRSPLTLLYAIQIQRLFFTIRMISTINFSWSWTRWISTIAKYV